MSASLKLSLRVSKLELEGSPPQVKWAATLRAKRVKELEELGWKGTGRMLREVMTADVLEKSDITTSARCHGYVKELIFQSLSEKSSSWWIENRGCPTEEIILEAHKKLIKRITASSWK